MNPHQTELDAAAARYDALAQELDAVFAFCASFGLDPERGRFGAYRREIAALADVARAGGEQSLDPTAREKFLNAATRQRVALVESYELVGMMRYLQSCSRGSIAEKLGALLGGPAMPEDEDENSNRARNIQFELAFASTLSQAGYAPILGEHPDVRIEPDRIVLFECKRIYASAKVAIRIKGAGEQLRRDLKNYPASSLGIVVISLSRVLNPTGEAFGMPSRDRGKAALEQWLTDAAGTVKATYQDLFARSLAVAILFFAESDFINLETGVYEHGTQLLVDEYRPMSAAYGPTLDDLRAKLEQKLSRG